MSEVVRTQQAHLFSGNENKEHGAARSLLKAGVGSGNFEKRGNAGSIIKRPMADVVAVDRRTDAEMIHMRRVDDVLVSKRRIRASTVSKGEV